MRYISKDHSTTKGYITKVLLMGLPLFCLSFCSTVLAYTWSVPRAIVTDRTSFPSYISITVGSNDNWHVVYNSRSEEGVRLLKYINSMSAEPCIIAEGDPGHYFYGPSIDIDPNGMLHVVYWDSDSAGPDDPIMYTTTGYKTYVLSVGVNWPDNPLTAPWDPIRGDLDALNLATKLKEFLPSCIEEPVSVCLDPSISDSSNLTSFQSAFGTLLNQVESGDTIILSFSSHGEFYSQKSLKLIEN